MASASLAIREAAPERFPEIWPIFRAVVQRGDAYPYPPETTQAQAQTIWCAPTHRVYIAEIEGKAVGSYYMRPNHPGLSSHVANAGYMVDPTVRSQGIGRQMGEHSLTEAARQGYRAMQFNLVVSTNEYAVRLWKSLGFSVLATLPGVFHHQELDYVDAYVMFREL